jgi:hypothetical protein
MLPLNSVDFWSPASVKGRMTFSNRDVFALLHPIIELKFVWNVRNVKCTTSDPSEFEITLLFFSCIGRCVSSSGLVGGGWCRAESFSVISESSTEHVFRISGYCLTAVPISSIKAKLCMHLCSKALVCIIEIYKECKIGDCL